MKIIFYSTHCPLCLLLKKRLDSAKIKYEEVNDKELMLAKGFTTVPQLEIDGVVYDLKSALKWIGDYIEQ